MRISPLETEAITQRAVEHLTSDAGCIDDIFSDQSTGRPIDKFTQPEKRLMSAILSDGIQSYFDAINKSKFEDESIEWVESHGSDAEYVFSFDCVCESLGLCSTSLREALLAMKYKALESPNTKVDWKRVRRPRIQ